MKQDLKKKKVFRICFICFYIRQLKDVPIRFVQALIRASTGPSSFSTSLSEAGVKMVSLVAKITS